MASRLLLLLCCTAAAAGVFGCADGDSDSAGVDAGAGSCTPGAVRACMCPGDLGRGSQICGTGQNFGACLCADAGPAADAGDARLPDAAPAAGDAGGDAADGASDAVGSDAAGDGAPVATGCVPSGMLATGKEVLRDVFPTPDGIIIVRADALVLVGRDRVVKKTIVAPRPISSASFDGTTLVTTDAAMLTIYSAALQEQGNVLLTEPCASSVLMDGGIFVCGPANDWDRVYYTYDVLQKKSVGRSALKYTYRGLTMRRVPGSNHFIAYGGTTSEVSLYRVEAGGTDVVLLNGAYNPGGIAVGGNFGFSGNPATHLITTEGLLVRIFGEGCGTPTTTPGTRTCLVKDGNLGTLWPNERFAALTSDDGNGLYAITSDSGASFFDPVCRNGCTVQKIDVAKRQVTSRRKHELAVRRFLGTRLDSTCGMVLVGYELATANTSSSEWGGYRVDLLAPGVAP